MDYRTIAIMTTFVQWGNLAIGFDRFCYWTGEWALTFITSGKWNCSKIIGFCRGFGLIGIRGFDHGRWFAFASSMASSGSCNTNLSTFLNVGPNLHYSIHWFQFNSQCSIRKIQRTNNANLLNNVGTDLQSIELVVSQRSVGTTCWHKHVTTISVVLCST